MHVEPFKDIALEYLALWISSLPVLGAIRLRATAIFLYKIGVYGMGHPCRKSEEVENFKLESRKLCWH